MRIHLRNRIVVDVNYFVEISDSNFSNILQTLEIKGLVWLDIHVQCNGGQIAHSNLKTQHRLFNFFFVRGEFMPSHINIYIYIYSDFYSGDNNV